MDFSHLGFYGLRELFNVHPLFVHFPIVLFPLSLFFYVLSIKIQKNGLRLGAHLILLLAAISVIITTVTGLIAENSITHNKTIHTMMETHETMGYFIIVMGIILGLWSFIRKGDKPYFFAGFIGMLSLVCLSILLNADLGARMVFVHGAGVKAAIPHHHDNSHQH